MMPRHLFSIIAILSGALSLNAQAVLLTLTGNAGAPNNYGNSLSYSQGGLSLTATAWSYSFGANDTAFETAGLGQYSTGLGVSNRNEGLNPGNPQHQVDNVGADDFVLFRFGSQVTINSVNIDPFGNWDRDVSYWVGTVAANVNLYGKTYAQLTALGFTNRVDNLSTVADAARSVSIGATGNAILFGAVVGVPNAGYEDYFKIMSISATPLVPIPEPTTALFGLALMGFCAAGRRRMQSA